MELQGKHPMLPDNTHDEIARQMYVSNLKLHLANHISPKLKNTYKEQVVPKFFKKNKINPSNRHEIRKAMSKELSYQLWSSLQRTSQEMKQDIQSEIAERQIDHLSNKAKKIKNESVLGSLKLNESLKIPRYMSAVDIHCIPGGYHNELIKDDVLPGAVYDPGVFLYSMGRMGAYNEDMGKTIISFIEEKNPQFKPKKILDMGCSVGHSTTPYFDKFSNAEIHAIDISAPFLRYGHARAKSMNKIVHFSQQNAEKTNFNDETFDLIVSHILLHETSHPALKNIIRECYRLLKPGGLMVHAETPEFKGMDLYDQFILDWDTYNNNEPFWGSLKEIDLKKLSEECGFNSSLFFKKIQTSAVQNEYATGRTKLFQGGDFGGAGAWFLFGCTKK